MYDKRIERYKSVLVCIAVTMILIITACSDPLFMFNKSENNTLNDNNNGTVSISIPPVSPILQSLTDTRSKTSRETIETTHSRNASRAFLSAAQVEFKLYRIINNNSNLFDTWWTYPGVQNIYGDESVVTSKEIPAGDYSLEVYVYNDHVSSNVPVVYGEVSFALEPAEQKNLSVVCVPYNPIVLDEGIASEPFSLSPPWYADGNSTKPGFEKWFMVKPSTAATAFVFTNTAELAGILGLSFYNIEGEHIIFVYEEFSSTDAEVIFNYNTTPHESYYLSLFLYISTYTPGDVHESSFMFLYEEIPPLPNLTGEITGVTLNDDDPNNLTITIAYKIENQGDAAVTQNFSVDFWAHRDEPPTNYYGTGEWLSLSSLEPGVIIEGSTTAFPNTHDGLSGTAYMFVDSENDIDESDETNNIASYTWTRSSEMQPEAGSLWNWDNSGHRVTSHTANSEFWYYGIIVDENTRNYDTGTGAEGHNSGSLSTPPFDIPASGSDAFILSFYYWLETENLQTYDVARVEISVDGGTTFVSLPLSVENYDLSNLPDTSGGWVFVSLDLTTTAFAGHNNVILRFFFDTIDGAENNYEGWYVDAITIGSIQQ